MTQVNHEPLVHPTYARAVHRWLLLCCLMVACMVVVGGATRLTDSGLSITEWKPVTGILPPLSHAQWIDEFKKYQQIPEYQQINKGISLTEFQAIYAWEYGHRLLGRIAGMVFALPLLWLTWKRALSRPFALRMAGILLLGASQGLMGWVMVKSGLSERTDVSHYRLAAHLLLAFLLFGALWWQALSVASCQLPVVSKRGLSNNWQLTTNNSLLLLLLLLQITLGAFVAGLDAGLVYNTFPTMDGQWIPSDLWFLTPWWRNFIEHTTNIQFFHRWIGISIALFIGVLWWRERSRILSLLLMAVCVQVMLGIVTLLWQVPLIPALIHQLMALVLFALSLVRIHGGEHACITSIILKKPLIN
jgi:cytochrome c oxidase assembly protein subunit 15